MKKLFALLLAPIPLIHFCFTSLAQTTSYALSNNSAIICWDHFSPEEGSEYFYAPEIKGDNQGNSYVITPFDSRGYDSLLLIKYNLSGTFQWLIKCYRGNSDNDFAPGDSGQVYVLVDNKVLKLDADGNILKSREVNEGYSDAYSIYFDSLESTFYVGGGSVTGSDPCFIGKYDAQLNQVWRTDFSLGFIKTILTDSDGNIFAAGASSYCCSREPALLCKLTQNGKLSWIKIYSKGSYTNSYNIILSEKSVGFAYTEETNSGFGSNLADFYKVSADNGKLESKKTVYDNYTSSNAGLIADKSGNFYWLVYEGEDVLRKYNFNEGLEWKRTISGGLAGEIVMGPTDEPVIVGNIHKSPQHPDEYIIEAVQFHIDGRIAWTRKINTDARSDNASSSICYADKIIIVGTSEQFIYRSLLIAALCIESPQSKEIRNPYLFSLAPNPFSSSAIVQFSLPANSAVQISLFDLQGRKIKTIAEANFSEGNHQVELKKENLTAGVYLLQLKTSQTTFTRKLIVE